LQPAGDAMRKPIVHLTFVYFFIAILLLNPTNAVSQGSNSPYPDVLLDNIWEVEYDNSDKFPILMKFFDIGYMVNISAHDGVNNSDPNFTYVGIEIRYNFNNDTLAYSLYTSDFKGKIGKDGTIKGKGRDGAVEFTKLRKATNQKLIDYLNSKKLFSFSPLSKLPLLKNELSGKLNSQVNIINTFDSYVAIAIVGENAASYFVAGPSGGIGFRYIPNGNYQMYYVYYNEPEILYQGDNISVYNENITITLEMVASGNYNIRKSN
jgi:hypothetical protein